MSGKVSDLGQLFLCILLLGGIFTEIFSLTLKKIHQSFCMAAGRGEVIFFFFFPVFRVVKTIVSVFNHFG